MCTVEEEERGYTHEGVKGKKKASQLRAREATLWARAWQLKKPALV